MKKQGRSNLTPVSQWQTQECDPETEEIIEVIKHTAFRNGAVIGYESETEEIKQPKIKRRKQHGT